MAEVPSVSSRGTKDYQEGRRGDIPAEHHVRRRPGFPVCSQAKHRWACSCVSVLSSSRGGDAGDGSHRRLSS